MAKVKVPEKEALLEEGSNPRFEALMRRYKNTNDQLEALKREKADKESELTNLKTLIRDEVVNMGISRGSTLRVAGVGKFHFTTHRYWRVPSGDERERLVRMLVGEGSESLLTVGKKDLNDWCKDRMDREEELPHFLKFHEDANVPVISLTKATTHKDNND